MLKSIVRAFSLFFLITGFAQAANLIAINDSYGIPVSKVITVEAFGVLNNDTLDGLSAGEAGVTTTLLTDVSQGVLSCPSNAGLALCADGSFEYTAGARFNGEDSFQYQAIAATGEIATATVTLSACSGGPTLFSCWHASAYRAKLTALGYNFFTESFEGSVWNVARTPDIGAAVTASSVSSKGIVWTTNHPLTNGISTGSGAARTGSWGGFDPAHGFATGTTIDCDVDAPPISCRPHDGLSGSGAALHAVGGYFSGTTGANIAIVLDGTNQINVGRLSDPGHHFFAVIDTAVAGFTDFEFRELDGKVGQELFVFADDFIIGTSGVIPANNPPVLNPIGNPSVNENTLLSILLTASDPEGDRLSFSLDALPLGASFVDHRDGTATFSWTPNLDQAGSYFLNFSVADNGVPIASDTEAVTITVVDVIADITSPVISLLGINPVNIELGSVYVDGGATALDNIDGNITTSITATSTVNTNVVGNYTVTYNVSDTAGNAATALVRTVNVTADATRPVITMLGATPINIELGSAYVDAGATALDNIDGPLAVITSNPVNVNLVGSYTITYDAMDAAGNMAVQAARTVNVTLDVTRPVIALLGTSPINIELGASYVDAGATALDNIDGVLAVTVNNPVNSNLVGTYVVTYNATDAAGNKAVQVTRTVNVTVDVTKPVITLLGNTPINIEVGSSYVDAGATALDNIDGVLAVTVNNPVNSNLVGTYVVTYNAMDAAGNTAVQVTRTVNVNHVTGLPGSLQFSSPVYSVDEGGLSASITVIRVNGSFGAVSVDYADVAGGSAIPGSDYTAMNGTLKFADGVTSQVISINVIDDAVYEGNETVNLLLSNVSGASLGMPSSAVLTIAENESVPPSGSLQFSAPVYSEKENGGTAIITVTRVGGSFGSAGLDYASANISAIADSDYTTASGRLSFADGELSQTFSVELIDDANYEGDETLNLILSNPTGGAGLGAPALAILTISENDPVPPSGSLQFSAPIYTVEENITSATITVTRVGGSFGLVNVNYTSVDGSATAGSDYAAVSGSLSFSDGQMSKTFSVELIDDANYEGDESLGLTLSNPTGGAGLGTPALAILTISENDPVPPSGGLQFSAASYSEAENGTTATITVTRVGGSFGIVSVDYASADGSAMAGSDYIAVSGNLSFADGITSQTFNVDIVDDANYEGDETLSLTLSNPIGGAGLSAPALALLTISENDPVPPSGSLQFSATGYNVNENGTSATITVSRVGGRFGLVSVAYASADGSATAGSDYRAVSGRLSFTDGEVSKTFSIEIIDDADYEGDETLNLTLSNPSGGAGLGAPAIASLLLIENETSEPVDNNVSTGGGGGGGVDLITLLFLISLCHRNFRIRRYVCH